MHGNATTWSESDGQTRAVQSWQLAPDPITQPDQLQVMRIELDWLRIVNPTSCNWR